MPQQSLLWPPPVTPFLPRNLSGIEHDEQKLVAEQSFDFVEVDGYREHFAEEDDACIRVFDVPWNQRLSFIEHMRGYSVTVQTFLDEMHPDKPPIPNGPPRLSRLIPAQHPERPYLYATRVETLAIAGAYVKNAALYAQDTTGNVKLTGPQNLIFRGPPIGRAIPLDMAAYRDNSSGRDGLVRYAVTYTALPYEVRNDWDTVHLFKGKELSRYVERDFNYTGSNLPFPANSMAWQDVPGTPRQLVGPPPLRIPVSGLFRIMGVMNLHYIWHQVPDPPWIAMQNCLGKVNSIDFDGFSGYPLFPAGTVMCIAPAKWRRKRNIAGRINWTLEYFMTYRSIPWNSFPALDGGFYPAVNVLADGKTISGNPPFPTADFNSLFTVPAPQTYQ